MEESLNELGLDDLGNSYPDLYGKREIASESVAQGKTRGCG